MTPLYSRGPFFIRHVGRHEKLCEIVLWEHSPLPRRFDLNLSFILHVLRHEKLCEIVLWEHSPLPRRFDLNLFFIRHVGRHEKLCEIVLWEHSPLPRRFDLNLFENKVRSYELNGDFQNCYLDYILNISSPIFL
jgi:hypothetical protein